VNRSRLLIRRGAKVVLAFVVGTTAFVAPVSAAHAHGATSCTAPQVAVAVSFAHWGGTAERGCASYTASMTGWSLLQRAGFRVTGTDAYPDTFVCKINDEPNTSCANTPPQAASWSYWHAAPGATSWTHTNLGAASAHPEAGSADAWNFGDTNSPPPFSPQSILPAVSVSHSAAPTSDATVQISTPKPPGTSHFAVPSASPPARVTSTSGPPTAAASARSGSARAPSTEASVAIDNVQPTAAAHKSGGSALPTVGVLVAVALIAGAGTTIAWRRRGRDA
jgi:hypothetical protein